jgi:uncharacterized membrane protein YfcA
VTLAAALLVLLAGLAVGATSIGGVFVVPTLTTFAGVAPAQAVAAASFGFAFTGVAAFATAHPRAARGTWPLDAGALVGAALGAATLAWLPAAAVRVAVGLVALASGCFALLNGGARRNETQARWPWIALVALGLLVGCVSAWSGTGGPVALLPLLALLRAPTAGAVAMAQRVQLPVAAAATTVNAAAGRLDVGLGLAIGVLVLAGWAAGQWAARRLPVHHLQQAVAVALIATGLWYL